MLHGFIQKAHSLITSQKNENSDTTNQSIFKMLTLSSDKFKTSGSMKNLMQQKHKSSSNTSRVSKSEHIHESVDNVDTPKIIDSNEVSKFNPKNYISQQKIKTMSSIGLNKNKSPKRIRNYNKSCTNSLWVKKSKAVILQMNQCHSSNTSIFHGKKNLMKIWIDFPKKHHDIFCP